jgi:penicillin-binding protein 1A
LELLEAYLPLANGGRAIKPWAIKRIFNTSGKLLWQRREKSRSVLDPRLSSLITSALKDTLLPGGTAAVAGRDLKVTAAGKTGTTQENRDAWFICYTPSLTTVVYVGNDHNHPLPAGGGALAAPIGVNFLNQALAEQGDRDFVMPSGIITRRICQDTGLLATPNCPASDEYFRFGHEPATYCTAHRRLRLRVCAKSGLLPSVNCRNTVEREYLWGEVPAAHCAICPPPRNLWQLLFGDSFSETE